MTPENKRIERRDVLMREVGLRDGLQLANAFLPTARKIEWIEADAVAGVAEIEVTSFVPPQSSPQFADADEVARAALAMDRFVASALALNLKGAIRAFDAGLRKVNYVVSASEAHSLANVRRSREDAIGVFAEIVQERERRNLTGRVSLSCGIATAFGCTIQGKVEEADIARIAGRFAALGADEILVADTVGYGNPEAVRRVFSCVVSACRGIPVVAHFHDTRGLGLANVVAALELGVRRFDASLGGLGGCPYAPGASGNLNLEDCVFMLEAMGLDTGIDIERLLAARRRLDEWMPEEPLTGAIRRVGLPKTFVKAAPTSLATAV
jgi:hydroxymethylglutaryl-CoA lyase